MVRKVQRIDYRVKHCSGDPVLDRWSGIVSQPKERTKIINRATGSEEEKVCSCRGAESRGVPLSFDGLDSYWQS